ncbi:hypothetical protein GC174_03820 [bacterium]|nr:hypothetical protein [bacterium]
MAENKINEGNDKVKISDRTEHTSKHTADEAVSDSERAERYEQKFTTFSDNDDDQSFKAIQPGADSFGIDFGDGTIETSKGKMEKPVVQDSFEAKGKKALAASQALKPTSEDSIPLGGHNYQPDQLIAANVTPSNPVVSDASAPINTDENKVNNNKQLLAQELDLTSPGLKTPVIDLVSPILQELIKMDPSILTDAYRYGIEHPYRDREFQQLSKIPESAWESAFEAFPELSNIAHLSKTRGTQLLKALAGNELDHYGKEDLLQDIATEKGFGGWLHGNTIGFSQQSPDGIKNMARILEEEVKSGKRASNSLHRYLEMTNKQLAEALLDPKQVPLFISANLASNTRMYQRHGYPINETTLGYGFNPDLLDSSGQLKHSLLPPETELVQSQHAKNVHKWLNKIQEQSK